MASGKYGNSRAIDVSDWGRPIARFFANRLKDTPVSVIMVTNFHLLANSIVTTNSEQTVGKVTILESQAPITKE